MEKQPFWQFLHEGTNAFQFSVSRFHARRITKGLNSNGENCCPQNDYFYWVVQLGSVLTRSPES